MTAANENQNVAFSATPEPEYEWGIQYHAPGGQFLTDWGYAVDPRTNGVIDEDGEVEIGSDYRTVTAVGKRQKSPEVWEILQ